MRLVLPVLLLMIGFVPTHAQETAPEPLAVPFVFAPPLMEFDANGRRVGFMASLARLVAEEIGAEIEFRETEVTTKFVPMQARGDTQLLAGVVRLPPLVETNLFSDPVAVEEMRLAVLADRAPEFSEGPVRGKRIGVILTAVGENIREVLDHNQKIGFNTADGAVMALLIGHVDALLAPNPVIFSLAKRAHSDGRIAFVGEPLRVIERVVALHESRAELLGPINDAVARLEADGRLEELRRRYNLTVPPPPPEVLTVGVADFPPYNIYLDDGGVTGFGVEATRDLARLAGLEIEFQRITQAEFSKGPSPTTYDMLPQAGVNAARLEIMDFTIPIEKFEFALFTRTGEASGLSGLDSIGSRKLGVVNGNLGERFASQHGGLDVHIFEDQRLLLQALVGGEIDVVLYPSDTFVLEAESAGMVPQIEKISPPVRIIKRAPALRPGLGAVRERLNAIIPGYLLSAEYAALREKYFGTPVSWTPVRIYALVAFATVMMLGMLVYVIWQREQQRQRRLVFDAQQRELELQQAHSKEREKLMQELQRSNRELEEFAYIASHDLKEPLRGIGINANFLLKENLPGKAGERVNRMGELSGRMEKLISDLLTFSRIGRAEAAVKIVRPAKVVETIRQELSEWLEEHGGQIVEVSAMPFVHADEVELRTVLRNLIVNGIKFNDSVQKRVEVGFDRNAEVNGQKIHNAFIVRDNGIGIDDIYRDKVFRIFSRLNPQAAYGPGTGSGLAFVRKIVEERGGMVDFASRPGTGTTFYFTLPLADAVATPAQEREQENA